MITGVMGIVIIGNRIVMGWLDMKTKEQLLREIADWLLAGVISKEELQALIEKYDLKMPF